MTVYRIGDCNYINDLSGKGAATHGGRWNSKEVYILYTAQSSALALLETVVHMGKMPNGSYCMATIELPGHSIEALSIDKLPANWNANPSPDDLKAIGDTFIKAGKHLCLKIPSVVMMEENNYLLNPAHPLFSKIKIIAQRPVKVDERLFFA